MIERLGLDAFVFAAQVRFAAAALGGIGVDTLAQLKRHEALDVAHVGERPRQIAVFRIAPAVFLDGAGKMAQRKIVTAFAAVHASVAGLDVAPRDVIVGLAAGPCRRRPAASERLWCGPAEKAASFRPRAWRRPSAPCRLRWRSGSLRRRDAGRDRTRRICGCSGNSRNEPERAAGDRRLRGSAEGPGRNWRGRAQHSLRPPRSCLRPSGCRRSRAEGSSWRRPLG